MVIYSFNKYLVSPDYVPGTTLGAGEMAVTKANPAMTQSKIHMCDNFFHMHIQQDKISFMTEVQVAWQRLLGVSAHLSMFLHFAASCTQQGYVINFHQRHVSRSEGSLSSRTNFPQAHSFLSLMTLEATHSREHIYKMGEDGPVCFRLLREGETFNVNVRKDKERL